MPATIPHATAEHPAEGFRLVVPPGDPNRPLHVYLPTDYQAKYAYPLLVLFHADGESEEQTARLVPLLSRRNYIALCARGSVALGSRADGRPTFGWDAKADRGVEAALAYASSRYSVHSGRVYLVGVGEGAAAAYNFAFARPECVAGVVALNGTLPADRIPANNLRVLIGHGSANSAVRFADVRRAARRLTAAGAAVRVSRYAASRRVHTEMLRDANRWIMSRVTGKPDSDG